MDLKQHILQKIEMMFTDEYLKNLLNKGFDVGAKYGSEETSKDMDSIDRLLNDFNISPGNEMQFLKQWMHKRIAFVINQLESQMDIVDDKVVCHRYLKLTDEELATLLHNNTELGEYWTYDRDAYIPGWGDDSKAHTIVIHGLVDFNDIDWMTTIERNANYLYGDDESELSIPDGLIHITSITDDYNDSLEFLHDNRKTKTECEPVNQFKP